MDKALKTILEEAITQSLSDKKAKLLFKRIMSGVFSEVQLSAILAALRARGETIEEIIGATKAMREHSKKIAGDLNAIDIVGTGGDGKGTLNISTASAIVVSGAGIKVAKHGNKNISSKSGAANVLESLGVNIMMTPEMAQSCLEEIGICFMMAPIFHPAMKNVMPVRNDLGIRTLFNILGPMTNPAGVKKQLTGTFSEKLLEPMAKTLLSLGTKSAWLVHGKDGTDEISSSDLTQVVEIRNGTIKKFTFNPVEYGFKFQPFEELIGGDPVFNASQLEHLLEGKPGAYRDSVLLNSAAAIYISGATNDIEEAINFAIRSIDEGKALNKLNELKKFSSKE